MRTVLTFIFLSLSWMVNGDVGKVTALEGDVRAIRPDQSERVLKKNAAVHVEERIVTGDESRVQIRFTDGSLLNLIPNSEYVIEAYQYRKLLKKDHYTGELVKGGFRTLSGSIAKKSPHEYEVKTPTSTIGLRGTIIEASIVAGLVYFGCESGLAVIFNSAGSQIIGPTAATQFAIVYSSTESPETLIERPLELERNIFSEPLGGFNIEKVQQQQQVQGIDNKFPASSSSSATSGSSGTSSGTSGTTGSTGSATTGGGSSGGTTPESIFSPTSEQATTGSSGTSGPSIGESQPNEPEWNFDMGGGSTSVIQGGCG